MRRCAFCGSPAIFWTGTRKFSRFCGSPAFLRTGTRSYWRSGPNLTDLPAARVKSLVLPA